MSAGDTSAVPFVQSVFHPSDFSPESDEAFVHALALAVILKAELTILHAGKQYLGDADWTRFPHVGETLERWKLLEVGSSPADVFRRLGVRINKIDATGSPIEAAMEHLEQEPADLMVVSTEGREGLPRWFRPSTAEQLSEAAGIMTLFVRHGVRPFVSADGVINMRRILVPVARAPDPRPALVYAARSTVLAGSDPVELVALHVGDGETMPPLELPAADNANWRTVLRPGEVVDQIVSAAEELEVDNILMATDGRNTVTEFLKGSHTEQVVRRAPCPVLAIPQD